MSRRKRPDPPEECSQCSAAIPRDAWACPACGADETTGWDDNPWLDPPVELPEDEEETDTGRVARGLPGRGGLSPIFWIAAVLVAVVLVYLAVHSRGGL
jgi:hypothetical protein